jgi:PAS domain S-box-containing protein
MEVKDLPVFDEGEPKRKPPVMVGGEAQGTESIDLGSLFDSRLTRSGSFDLAMLEVSAFGRLLQAIPIPALMVDTSCNMVFLNEWCLNLGDRTQDLDGRPFHNLFPHPSDSARIRALLDEVLAHRKPAIVEGILQFGSKRLWGRIHFQSLRFKGRRAILVLIEDLTMTKKQLLLTKKHQEELKAARDQLEKRVDDRTAELQAINELLRREIGERKRVEAELLVAQEALGKRVEERTDELLAANRQLSQEIKERERIESALRESEEKYRTIVETVEDGYYEVDLKGNFLFVNEPACEMVGFSRTEMIGANYCRGMSPEETARIWGLFNTILKTGRSLSAVDGRIIRKDGTERDVQFSAALVKKPDGRAKGFRGIIRDVTEQKRAEAELSRLEKLESVGVLAGGIAHDFNNILTAIQGNISLAKLYSPPGGKVLERLEEAERASIRARDLTQQLLTFSRGGAPIKRTASVADIACESCEFALRGSNVRCEFAFPEEMWSVEVDPGQISQVVSNLVINADQAMPQGGVVYLSGENVVVEKGSGVPLPEGKYVAISIQDQGHGIAEEHLSKIFDPYFTTKQKGSGLGLATAYSIVKNHEGLITVESKLGAGSTFRVLLPASEKQLPPALERPENLVGGLGRVLIMDDEEPIRTVASEMLSLLGYEAEVARDGFEALERCEIARQGGRPFDAVILDLTVPGSMGGAEAIQRIRDAQPGIKALVSSGYSNDPVMADHGRFGFDGVVAKPYSAKDVGNALKQVMGVSFARSDRSSTGGTL